MSSYVRKLIHRPLTPARQSVPLEGALVGAWQEFIARDVDRFKSIINTPHTPRQRAASVAASFMKYMGCNSGRSFDLAITDAIQTGVYPSAENAALATWAVHNKRSIYGSTGVRAIEVMLAVNNPFDSVRSSSHVNWSNIPQITQEDFDVVESMVIWWATTDADRVKAYAKACVDMENAKASI